MGLWFGLSCLQNVLRELEQKKPQLDELVHTAENLKADSNRQQLHGKGRILPARSQKNCMLHPCANYIFIVPYKKTNICESVCVVASHSGGLYYAPSASAYY